jgi:SH3 domain protein
MGYFMRLVWLGLVGQLVLATTLYARTMYVSDVFEIVMRSDKGTQSKIIRLLPTGTSVEVTDETDDSWAAIELPDGTAGYVLKRYLISRLPYSLTAERLRQEAEQQKTRLATLTEQLTLLQDEHQRLQTVSSARESELAEITKKYEQLRQDASNYLQLKANYTDLQHEFRQSEQQLGELNDRYMLLKKSRNLLWFLSGAGVMLAGWIIGLITERFRGRRRRQGGYSYQLPH